MGKNLLVVVVSQEGSPVDGLKCGIYASIPINARLVSGRISSVEASNMNMLLNGPSRSAGTRNLD